uniref:Nonsense-mediated mRNA decay factor SMG8 n=5 Tax=Schistocephalus solidus TaxID=70667 RepID=A0A0V0J845_SCHSO
MATPAYCGGRFPVPPAFDFVLLPLKTKKVAVVSIIGSWDSLTCGSTSQLIENFLQKSVFSLPCGKSVIQGFYDCERQLIFLQFRDTEYLLDELLSNAKNSEDILTEWDMERLKYLYYLFLVSHFILIVSYGTNLDPRYVALFKLLNRIRTKLRHSVETLLRTLPLPRYCIAAGRIATPRLLFLFKLPPTISARKLAENEYALLALEKNLVNQIFNVFYESGLLDGNSSETRLFDLMGYSYVRVLYPDVVEPLQKFTDDSNRDSLAQQLLEDLVNTVRPSALENSDRRTAPPPLNPLYPPPDRPDDRSFEAFLQCHLSSLLDDANVRGSGDGHSHFAFELPSCKAWFIACYKLYTCLMSEPDAAVGRSPRTPADAETSTGLSLAKSWQQLFSTTTVAVSDHLGRSPTFAVQAMLEQKLSEIRSEAALTAAEAHYRQDLPAHYSSTYHLAKVISAYNVFLSHARGVAVLPALDHLTRRLARLYLAGQVGCSALSVSGVLCRQEMHRLPDRFPGITSAFQSLQHKEDGGGAAGGSSVEELGGEVTVVKPLPHHRLAYYASRIASATEMDDVEAAARKACVGSSLYGRVPGYKEMLSESAMEIPPALTGLWRCQWVLTVLKYLVAAADSKSEKAETDAMASVSTQKAAPPATGGQGAMTGSAAAENPQTGEDQSTLHLAVMQHRSDMKFISSCNCGRQQAPRPDPFDYREANWEFYNSLALSCCSKLNSVALAPEFLNSSGHHFTTTTPADDASPVVDEVAAVSVNVALAAADPAIVPEETKNKKVEDGDLTFGDEGEDAGSEDLGEAFFNANDEFASENEASTSESSVAFEHPSSSLAGDRLDADGVKTADEDPEDAESQDSETPFVTPRGGSHHPGRSDQSESEEELDVEKEGRAAPAPQRLPQPRKVPVFFYDAMPTLCLPPGHLPLYASWAIHTLGKYFSYSHSSGFAYPGFLRGSNFLLPWDVQLSRTTNWQSSDRGGRGGRNKGRQRDFDTIKLFVGFEMECCLGHRFFLAGPQRAMVGLMQGCDVRRAVSSLLSRDLPIYMPCRCSKATPPDNTTAAAGEAVNREVGGSTTAEDGIVWAQLMRVYMALPAAPVRIRFQPRVRHGPLETQTPIFHLGPTLDEQMDMDQPKSSRTLLQEGGLPADRGENADDSLSDNSETPSRSAVRVPPVSRKSGPQAGYVYLDNGYLWVARLPFAYQSGSILYRRPKNPLLSSECCLLGGSITLEEL